MLSRTLVLSFRGGDSLNNSFVVSGGAESSLSELIPAPSAPLALVFTMDVSQLKLVYLVSDQDIILHTNDNAAPVNTFTLKAGVPFAWAAGGAALRDTAGTAVATDITALYAVNAGDTAAQLEGRFLYDPTP